MARPESLQSLVVPTDFSKGAQQALERALQLPLAKTAQLTLLHVLPNDIPGTLRDQAIQEARAALKRQVAWAERTAQARGLTRLTLKSDVLEGNPAQAIVRRARSVEADAIVMGRHGQRPVLDLFLGSTALKVVRLGEVPVLLVQLPAKAPYQHPLVGVELDTDVAPVLTAAARVAMPAAKRLTAMHCLRSAYELHVTLHPQEHERLRSKAVSESMKVLRGLLARAQVGVPVDAEIVTGDPRSGLVQLARARRVDLLILGTHARRGLQRLLLGSVAEWVLTHAPCDVLVLRAR